MNFVKDLFAQEESIYYIDGLKGWENSIDFQENYVEK